MKLRRCRSISKIRSNICRETWCSWNLRKAELLTWARVNPTWGRVKFHTVLSRSENSLSRIWGKLFFSVLHLRLDCSRFCQNALSLLFVSNQIRTKMNRNNYSSVTSGITPGRLRYSSNFLSISNLVRSLGQTRQRSLLNFLSSDNVITSASGYKVER